MDQESTPKPEPAPQKPEMTPEHSEQSRVDVLKDKLSSLLRRNPSQRRQTETQEDGNERPPIILQFEHAHKKFEQLNPKNPELVETFDHLFEAFNSKLLENSTVFEAENGQASFPYTRINVTDFAREMLKAPPTEPGTQTEQPKQTPKTEKYVILGSHLILKDGQFTYVEIALHEFVKRLPAVLKDLEAGRIPNEVDIILTGAPTSMFGRVTPEFASEVQKAPTQTYAQLYEEFIDGQLPQDEQATINTHVTLHGYSMGASWAARTAELMKDKDPDSPETLVLMDSPAGMHELRVGINKLRLKAGFGIDGAIALATRGDTRHFILNESKYWKRLAPYLERHNGYKVHLDPEQTTLKKGIVSATVKELESGIPVDTNKIKAVVRWGTQDLSMLTGSFRQDVENRKEDLERKKVESVDPTNSIVKNKLPGYEPRTFAVKSPHIHPFFRRNEVRRWQNTTRVVQEMTAKGLVKLPKSLF